MLCPSAYRRFVPIADFSPTSAKRQELPFLPQHRSRRPPALMRPCPVDRCIADPPRFLSL